MNTKDLPYPERMQALTELFKRKLTEYVSPKDQLRQINQDYDRRNAHDQFVRLALEIRRG